MLFAYVFGQTDTSIKHWNMYLVKMIRILLAYVLGQNNTFPILHVYLSGQIFTSP